MDKKKGVDRWEKFWEELTGSFYIDTKKFCLPINIQDET
jgi:hypothetical protein